MHLSRSKDFCASPLASLPPAFMTRTHQSNSISHVVRVTVAQELCLPEAASVMHYCVCSMTRIPCVLDSKEHAPLFSLLIHPRHCGGHIGCVARCERRRQRTDASSTCQGPTPHPILLTHLRVYHATRVFASPPSHLALPPSCPKRTYLTAFSTWYVLL